MSAEQKEFISQEPQFTLECLVHGEVGVVVESKVETLANQHREEFGCYYSIAVIPVDQSIILQDTDSLKSTT